MGRGAWSPMLLTLLSAVACSQGGQGHEQRDAAGLSGAGGSGASGGVGSGAGGVWGTGGGAGTGGAAGSGSGGSVGSGGRLATGGASGTGTGGGLGGGTSIMSGTGGATVGSGGGAGTGGRSGTGGSTGRDASADVLDGGDASVPDRAPDVTVADGRDGAGGDIPSDIANPPTDASACPAPGPGVFGTSATHLNIGVHDPAIMSDGKRLYLFATGGSLSIRSSADGLQWSNAGKVFASVPSWVTTTLNVSASGFELWAPDISFFNCKYHVYYAGSAFGKNTSVIGLATSPTLDPSGAGYGWTDEGLIVQSKTSDSFNAIDPNVAFDDTGTPWLSWGSFWDGIKMRRLDPATGKVSTTDTTLYSLASRKGTGDAIEAPSIISHNGYYYLFVSFDACCKGVDSTYRSMVGRGSKITGPYTDKAGTAMTKGAAEALLATSGRYVGPGGGTAFKNGDAYYYAFHYYDGSDNGNAKLQIRPVTFSVDDWPVLGDPLFP